MNDIIQNLAIQAAGKGFNTFSTSDLDTQEKIERFAELIIRECVSLCSKTASGRDAEAIEEAMLNHFGVEE